MIQFRGTPSEEVRKFFLRSHERFFRIIALFAVIFLICPMIALGIIWHETLIFVIPFAFSGILACILTSIPKINPQDKNVDAQIPNSVTIKGDHLERVGEGANSYSSRKMIDVKKVRDYGNFYYLTFYFPYKDGYFVCQKDLLVEGTLEEFEKLFEDKLERMV